MFIYKTTNIINGKIYIGQCCSNNPAYLGSGKILKLAIKKYGKNSFQREVIEECSSINQLNEREQYWINYYQSADLNIGYNIALGGSGKLGCKHSEATKKLFSQQRQGGNNPNFGKPLSDKQKEILRQSGRKRTESKNTFFGRQHTKNTKEKIRQANSIQLTQEIEQKIITLYKHYGVKLISQKLGLGRKKVYNVLKQHNIMRRKIGPIPGNPHPRKPISSETKRKLSEAFSGEKHPMWGIRGKQHPLYKQISEEDQGKIIEAYIQGITTRKIQKTFHISMTKIKEVLQENKIPMRGRGNYVRETH